jgi:uncharacterized protein involved in exopolysaccharide biosynthesis/Mrp family chromosome partitioning ATPase
MLDHIPSPARQEPHEAPADASESELLSFADIRRFLARYARTIGLTTLLMLLVAGYVVLSSKSLYTASAQVLIDPRISQIQREQLGEVAMPLDTAQIESQLALLRSEGIARLVIAQLDLVTDPEFQPRPPRLVARLLRKLVSPPAEPSSDDNVRAAVAAFQGGLDVVRVGISYGIQISFSSADPHKAARIANAIASIYVRDQLDVRSKAAQAGSLWLEEKINLLRRKMNQAARAAQEFKASHDYRLMPARERKTADTVAIGGIGAPREPEPRRGDTAITLEELESTAQTYRKLYESYLLAYTEVLQRDSYPVSNARVISTAMAPLVTSHPRTQLILTFGALAGLLAGIGISLLRNMLDHTVASARQLREETGIACLGQLPRLASRSDSLARQWLERLLREPRAFLWGLLTSPRGTLERRGPPARPTIQGNIVLETHSPYSDGMQSLKAGLQLAARRRPLRTIGVVSVHDDPQRASVAANLAALYALSGTKSLLVDADLRHNGASSTFAPGADKGLVDCILDPAAVAKSVRRPDALAGADFLPVRSGSAGLNASELVGSEAMRTLLASLTGSYGIVIVDLPPVQTASEGLALGALLDGLIVVVERNRTPTPLVVDAAQALRAAHAQIVGAVVTGVDHAPTYAAA